ncbi:MAG: transporter [Planctomycetota bacterium]|nr:MAG: transporter [Planctomycetota bacterium]
MPDAFSTASEPSTAEAERVQPTWWHDFVQPELRALVEEALANNPDVAAVAARLAAAGARFDVAGAARLPSAQLGLTGQRVKRNFIGFPGGSGAGSGPVSIRSTAYELGLDTSWELDLFGRLGAAVEAAQADEQAAYADLAGARLALIGAVLKSAYAAVEAEQQRELAVANAATWERNEAVLEQRYRAGLRPAFDARRVASQRATAESNVQVREREARDTLRRLERLLGRAPTGRLVLPRELPNTPSHVPAGLPAELLARRPDLAAAERRLLASERRVAASRAALYPRLTLTGGVGTSSDDIDDLLDGDFSVWDLGAQLVLPLFEGGELRARVVEAESAATESLLGFTAVLLDALSEVERALDASASLALELDARAAAADDARRARELARERYRRGLGDLLELLDAERTALLDAATHVRVRRELLDARVDLHLALGGGFDASQLDDLHDDTDPESDS